MRRHRSSTPWAVLGVVSSPWPPTTSSTTTVSGWLVVVLRGVYVLDVIAPNQERVQLITRVRSVIHNIGNRNQHFKAVQLSFHLFFALIPFEPVFFCTVADKDESLCPLK